MLVRARALCASDCGRRNRCLTLLRSVRRLVLNATIDKYAYATLEPTSQGKRSLVAADRQENWEVKLGRRWN